MSRTTPVIAALMAVAAGCQGPTRRPEERRPPRPEPGSAAPSPEPSVAPAVPEPEETTLEVVYPSADAGDIAAEVEAFTSLERCSASLGDRLPPGVAEVLGDIGYGAMAMDACRTLKALASRSLDQCEGLLVRYAKIGCRRRYAMYHGDPDLCPSEPARSGRDPTCVAVAMRDHSLCRAAPTPREVGICRSIVLRSERPCRAVSHTALEAASCAAAARRWWSAMPPEPPSPALPFDYSPHLEIRLGGTPGDGGAPTVEDSPLLDRGIVVGPEELVIGARSQPPIGEQPPLVELRLPLPEDDVPESVPIGPSGARIWVRFERRPPIDSTEPMSQVTGEVTIERFRRARGARIEGRATVDLGPSGATTGPVEISFSTFVRDVVEDRSEDS